MKNLIKAITAAGILLQVAVAQDKWTVDPAHTNTRFEVSHLGIAFVDGQFKSLAGTVDSKTATDFNEAKIDFTIDVNSIDTRIEARDNHLKSADFFDVAKFPTISLKNGILKKGANGKYTLTGDLTLRDVTKSVTFDVVQNNGIITDPWGKTRAGFTATLSINRFDYNISYNDKLPSGVDAVAPIIKITVNTEIVKD